MCIPSRASWTKRPGTAWDGDQPEFIKGMDVDGWHSNVGGVLFIWRKLMFTLTFFVNSDYNRFARDITTYQTGACARVDKTLQWTPWPCNTSVRYHKIHILF